MSSRGVPGEEPGPDVGVLGEQLPAGSAGTVWVVGGEGGEAGLGSWRGSVSSAGQRRFGEKLQWGVGRELGTDGGRALVQRDDTGNDV